VNEKTAVTRALDTLWNTFSTTREPDLPAIREAVETLNLYHPGNPGFHEAIAEAGALAAATFDPGELDGPGHEFGPLVIATVLSVLAATIANEHGWKREANLVAGG
jgi:hypothetical protein